jgi:hypothetical protein
MGGVWITIYLAPRVCWHGICFLGEVVGGGKSAVRKIYVMQFSIFFKISKVRLLGTRIVWRLRAVTTSNWGELRRGNSHEFGIAYTRSHY